MRSTHRSHNVLRGFILRRVQCIISFLLCTLSLRRQTFSGCLVAVVSPSSPLLSRNECPAEQWGPTRIRIPPLSKISSHLSFSQRQPRSPGKQCPPLHIAKLLGIPWPRRFEKRRFFHPRFCCQHWEMSCQ